jgi:hypothetical protein
LQNRPIYYAGVAESSGEFGVWSKSSPLPNSQIGSFGDWMSC